MNIIKKYTSMSRDMKCAIWFAFCSFLQKAIVLLSMPIFSRILSVEEYGVLSIYNSWTTIVFYIATLNFSGAYYNVLMNKEREKKNENATTLLILSTFLSLFVFIIFLIFKEQVVRLTGLNFYLLVIMLISCVSTTSYGFWQIQQRFEKKYVLLVVSTILFSVLSIVIPVLSVIYFDKTAFSKILGTEIVNFIFGLLFGIYFLIKSKKIIDFTVIKKALIYSLPLIPHFMSSIILNQLDRVMIYNVYGYELAAFYGIAHTIGNMFSFLVIVVNNTFLPFLYENIEKERIDKIRKISNFIFLGCTFILIFYQLITPELVAILADKQYAEVSCFVPILSLSQYFVLIYYMFANVEYYYEKTKLIAFASVIGCITNFVLNFILIPYNYIYAAYTTAFSMFVYVCVHYIFMRKITKEKIYNIKLIIFLILIAILSTLISIILIEFIFIRILIIILLIISAILIIKYKKEVFKL